MHGTHTAFVWITLLVVLSITLEVTSQQHKEDLYCDIYINIIIRINICVRYYCAIVPPCHAREFRAGCRFHEFVGALGLGAGTPGSGEI